MLSFVIKVLSLRCGTITDYVAELRHPLQLCHSGLMISFPISTQKTGRNNLCCVGNQGR